MGRKKAREVMTRVRGADSDRCEKELRFSVNV